MGVFSVAVVTSTRADYGLLRPVISRIAGDPVLELKLYVTGAHLMPELGSTVSEIDADGFPYTALDIMTGTNGDSVTAMANALRLFGAAFEACAPDVLLVLGDRYEIFAVCVAAAARGVPIAHISGGETTEGAKDEYYRHCITKMSSLHFPAAEIYRKRIIQMGEQPGSVITAGALGIENAKKLPQVDRETLTAKYGFDFYRPFILATYHPETMGNGSEGVYPFTEALAELGMPVLFTKANADEGGDRINAVLQELCSKRADWKLVPNLGAVNYFSTLGYCVCVAGNSSSALTEAPAMGKPSVNVGNRQKGRYTCDSVITCAGDKESVLKALKQAVSPEFQKAASASGNPFYVGKDASEVIVSTLKERLEAGLFQNKSFYDI